MKRLSFKKVLKTILWSVVFAGLSLIVLTVSFRLAADRRKTLALGEGALARSKEWAQLELPVRLIWGDKDHVTPLAQGNVLAGLIKGATLTVLPDTGHIPQIEAPIRFQRALIDALNSITTLTDQR